MNNWPTKKQDLQIAQGVLDKYVDWNDGEPLKLYEWVVENRLELTSDMPEWVIELKEAYQNRYGSQRGIDITRKVLSNCLVRGAMIH